MLRPMDEFALFRLQREISGVLYFQWIAVISSDTVSTSPLFHWLAKSRDSPGSALSLYR